VTNNKKVSRLWWALLLPLCLSVTQAGTTGILKDINTSFPPASSNPEFLGKLGNVSLYQAYVDGQYRLVRSDGTAAGTFTIKSFTGYGVYTYSLLPFIANSSRGYFVAHDSATGFEVWTTDGTAAGTRLVAELVPGNGDFPQLRGMAGNGLVFDILTEDHVRQIYFTDGTNGAVKVADIADPTTIYINMEFAAAAGKFYFTALDADCNNCFTLWSSDGTASGTQRLTGLSDFSTTPFPRSLRAVGNRVVLTSAVGGGAGGLFAIDPATDDISLVMAPSSGPVSNITVMNGYAYLVGRFAANSEELWRSDGTVGGTTQVTTIQPTPGAGNFSFDNMAVVGDRILLSANDGTNGMQLWSTDGTVNNETRITAMPGITSWDLDSLPATGRNLVLKAIAGTTTTLVRTDGTLAGTRPLPTTFESQPLTFLDYTGDAAREFLRFSHPGPGNVTSYSLFRYTPGAATELTLLRTGSNSELAESSLSMLNGALFFNAADAAQGDELWINDAAGTRVFANLAPENATGDSYALWLTTWNGRGVFVASDGTHGDELWESDGTEAGTRLLFDLNPGPDGSSVSDLMVLDGALYFFAFDGTASRFMKLAPGSTAPELLTTLDPQADMPAGYPPLVGRCGGARHAILGGRLYFAAGTPDHGFELWTSDGSAAGTRELLDIHSSGDATPCDFTLMNGRLYFSADGGTGNGGIELWSTDGTAGGTRRVVDLAAAAAGSNPQSLVAMDDRLYFVATVSGSNHLYVSDGSAAGTVQLKPGALATAFPAYPIGIVNGRLALLKTVTHNFAPLEIWTTDGTAAGTLQLPEMLAHPFVTPLFTSSGTRMYFTHVSEAGSEPWVSDGTAEGTLQLLEADPETSSTAAGYMEFRGKVVIAIQREVTVNTSETELWQTPAEEPNLMRLGISGSPVALGFNLGADFLVLGQSLLFTGFEPQTGAELFVVRNDQPVAMNDTAGASTAQPAVLHPLNNDSDPDGTLDPGSFRIVQGPTHGTLWTQPDGSIVYSPNVGYSGTDSFTYTVADDQGFESNTGVVSLNVSVNVAPAKKRGGGALQWWTVLPLALLAATGIRRRQPPPCRQR